jgi:MraZ protein
MALFAGTFENKVDGKGRVSVPAPFRAELEDGHAGAVYLYPSLEFEAIEACTVEWMEEMKAGIARLPKFSKERRALSMSVFGRARLIRLEETGRLVLPKDMADRAGVGEKACFIGMGESFLIWNPEAAEAELNGATQTVIDEGLTIDTPYDVPGDSGGGRRG